MNDHKQEPILKLENTYGTLPPFFFATAKPEHVPNPELVLFNEGLAEEFGIDKEIFLANKGVDILAGNQIPLSATPLAMSYGGHQFGHFTKLGDGRAILLGEYITPLGERVDIQLKGSGRTTYSRGGDGKATLSAMLREYVMSEAMYGLGIPTTRSLAVVKTGEQIMRQKAETGAILTRTAASHLRVGTFAYTAKQGTINDLKTLADYTINRHYPQIKDAENPYISLLEIVIDRQASLVSKWNLVGFIHGVMNTDNVTISGETIDYGPCAFMDDYGVSTVFSSIDRDGRYSYGNQPAITQWNMARFAEALLPLIDENMDHAITICENAIRKFPDIYHGYWITGMCHKLGISDPIEGDEQLVNRLLAMMEQHKADFTNTFKALTMETLEGITLFETKEFEQWNVDWKKRLTLQKSSKEEVKSLMKQTNPAIIPRNHIMEKALKDADIYGNMQPIYDFLEALKEPYAYTTKQNEYSHLNEKPDTDYRTYCGT